MILSGKGGTGKTSIAGSLAALANNAVLVDCDVDAADLHLLLQPVVLQNREFWSGQSASINVDKCNECGLCQDLCHFQAIKDFRVDRVSCEGCGFCSRICPAEAITMNDNMAGHWFVSDTLYGTLIHARLGIAQENSGKLVATVRQQARAIAEKQKAELIISDGPPGTSCPVISSLSGATLAVLVTEPTLSGIHDLERILGICRHFNVSPVVCINKYDINESNSGEIEAYCQSQNTEVLAGIPFDNMFTEAMTHGLPIVKYAEGHTSGIITELWQNILKRLNTN